MLTYPIDGEFVGMLNYMSKLVHDLLDKTLTHAWGTDESEGMSHPVLKDKLDAISYLLHDQKFTHMIGNK